MKSTFFLSSFALAAAPFAAPQPQANLTMVQYGASSDLILSNDPTDVEWAVPIGTAKGRSETTYLYYEVDLVTATITSGNSKIPQTSSETFSATLVASASGFQMTASSGVVERHATASDSGDCVFAIAGDDGTQTITNTGPAAPFAIISISASSASTTRATSSSTAPSWSVSPTHSGASGKSFEWGMFRVVFSDMVLGGFLVL